MKLKEVCTVKLKVRGQGFAAAVCCLPIAGCGSPFIKWHFSVSASLCLALNLK